MDLEALFPHDCQEGRHLYIICFLIQLCGNNIVLPSCLEELPVATRSPFMSILCGGGINDCVIVTACYVTSPLKASVDY